MTPRPPGLRLRASLSPGALPQAFAGNEPSSNSVGAGLRRPVEASSPQRGRDVRAGAWRRPGVIAGSEVLRGAQGDRWVGAVLRMMGRRYCRWDAGEGRGGRRGGSAGAAGGERLGQTARIPESVPACSLALARIFRRVHDTFLLTDATSSSSKPSKSAVETVFTNSSRRTTQIGHPRPWPLRRLRAFPSPSRPAQPSSRRTTQTGVTLPPLVRLLALHSALGPRAVQRQREQRGGPTSPLARARGPLSALCTYTTTPTSSAANGARGLACSSAAKHETLWMDCTCGAASRSRRVPPAPLFAFPRRWYRVKPTPSWLWHLGSRLWSPSTRVRCLPPRASLSSCVDRAKPTPSCTLRLRSRSTPLSIPSLDAPLCPPISSVPPDAAVVHLALCELLNTTVAPGAHYPPLLILAFAVRAPARLPAVPPRWYHVKLTPSRPQRMWGRSKSPSRPPPSALRPPPSIRASQQFLAAGTIRGRRRHEPGARGGPIGGRAGLPALDDLSAYTAYLALLPEVALAGSSRSKPWSAGTCTRMRSRCRRRERASTSLALETVMDGVPSGKWLGSPGA
ncbi:hypothetical protein DFH09DRAFT_1381016 [Mycena vulgaris]|nr:hypothetical protein DFH09DRAFT_1381016 [Mycena vulgaris]